MKVNVQIDKGRIRSLSFYAKKSVAMTAEQLRTELIQANVVPFEEGTLQNVQTYIETKALNQGEVQIIHDTPYAARLYFNPQFKFDKTINKNARGEWWEPWLKGDKKQRASELFKKFYRKLTGVD